MRIDPARLLLLLRLHEDGSITRTAERTGRTPPAVSQQLARLEEVGAQLVVRHPHGVRLTPLGSRLTEYADQVAGALRRADEATRHYLGEHRDRLRLGAFPTAGLGLLPDALAALRHRLPEAELSVVDLGPTEGITLVSRHQLDVALVGEYSEPVESPYGVELVTLLDDPIDAVMPTDHPKADTPHPCLQDFASDSWACAPVELPNRRQLDIAAAKEGLSPAVPFESESYAVAQAVAQAVVSAGVAVSFVPGLALSHAPGTVHRKLAEPGPFRRIHAAVPTNTTHAPLTPVFLRLLHEVCAELGA